MLFWLLVIILVIAAIAARRSFSKEQALRGHRWGYAAYREASREIEALQKSRRGFWTSAVVLVCDICPVYCFYSIVGFDLILGNPDMYDLSEDFGQWDSYSHNRYDTIEQLRPYPFNDPYEDPLGGFLFSCFRSCWRR